MNLRNSPCPNHVQLDLFLLGCDQGALSWIDEHLKSCPLCRFQAERRRNDFAAYAEAVSGHQNGVVQRVYTFEPWKSPSVDAMVNHRLAAKGTENSEPRTSITMISTDKQIMMKVVQDQQSNEAWLYLLSDDPELCRHALVYPFKMDRGYVSDAHGRVNLGKIDWPTDDQLTAELRLPSASFHLAPLVEVEQGRPQVIESSNGDILKVVYHAEGEFRRLEIQIIELKGITPDSPVRMAVCERNSTHLQVLHSTRTPCVNISGVKDPGAIELYLYQ